MFEFTVMIIPIIIMFTLSFIIEKTTGPKSYIPKKINELGGTLISTKKYLAFTDRHNSCVKEAIKLKSESSEESLFNSKKHDKNYFIYDVKYSLNSEEKRMYYLVYLRKLTYIGSKKFDAEWVTI